MKKVGPKTKMAAIETKQMNPFTNFKGFLSKIAFTETTAVVMSERNQIATPIQYTAAGRPLLRNRYIYSNIPQGERTTDMASQINGA